MIYKWGDLISLEYGKPVPDKAIHDGTIPVFGTNGRIGTSNCPPLCNHESFVIGRKGAYRGVHYSDVPFSVIDTAFYVENQRPDILILKWAYYKFLTYDINRMDSGSAIPSTDRYTIYAIQAEIPPIDEQIKQVSILDALAKKIVLNMQINEKLEQKGSALIGLVFSNTSGETTLSEIMTFENGFPFQSKTYQKSGKYRIVTIKNVLDGRMDLGTMPCLNALPDRLRSGCVLHPGDVLLSLTGNVGRVAAVSEKGLLLNQRVAKVVPHDEKLLPYLYFLLRNPSLKQKMEMIARGTAQLNLSPIETLELKIPFETGSVCRLADILCPLYKQIIQNSHEIIVLSTIRDTLLPRLLSGELDVSGLDI